MKELLFATFCISFLFLGLVQAQHPPRGPPQGKFRDPLDIKRIVIDCDTDKSGELSTEEFSQCTHSKPDVKSLDLNGDMRVERHEIKQSVKLAKPDMEKDRQAYLDEIGRFKDMVRDCDEKTPESNRGDGEISYEEGQRCLHEFPQYKDLFEEIDQEVNGIKDRVLVKQELKNQVSRIREKNHVASGRQRSYGPTTPMN